jgi:glycine/D-amino acid oxidase-like deaminating enzyme
MCPAHTLLATALRRGATLYDGEATRFEATGGGLADGGTIEAERVVLATGFVMPDCVVTDMHRPSSSWRSPRRRRNRRRYGPAGR